MTCPMTDPNCNTDTTLTCRQGKNTQQLIPWLHYRYIRQQQPYGRQDRRTRNNSLHRPLESALTHDRSKISHPCDGRSSSSSSSQSTLTPLQGSCTRALRPYRARSELSLKTNHKKKKCWRAHAATELNYDGREVTTFIHQPRQTRSLSPKRSVPPSPTVVGLQKDAAVRKTSDHSVQPASFTPLGEIAR